jgi:poly(hydroxyalkanoate) depolymerase family esterase
VDVPPHGCSQSAAAYENAGWNPLSDTYKFYVVYAQQQPANNMSLCFNWFASGDLARDQGEALSIKQMVDKMKASLRRSGMCCLSLPWEGADSHGMVRSVPSRSCSTAR